MLKASGADKFANAFKNAADSVNGMEKSTQGAGLTIGKLVGAIGITAALAKGFGMVRDSVSRAFGRIDTMEQFDRVMTTMTGSSQKAQSVLDEVNDTVKGTAYGLDVGAKAVQGFVTSNMDVDKATATFKSWGDAVAFYGDGTSETLGSVTDALAKATAKGKIQMDTMNRLSEAGIPAMQIYADATGQSVEDVADLMADGALDAKKFIDVMNDAMANGTKNFKSIDGAAKEAGASWTGSFDNMRAAVARGVIGIIQSIDTMLTSNGLPDMRAMVALFGAKFEEVLKKAAESIPIMVAKLKEVYTTIKPWMPLIQAVGAAVIGMVAAWSTFNTVKGIIDGVKGSFKALNLIMAANPWVLIIGAVIAAAVLIYKYWDDIKAFLISTLDKIESKFLGFMDSILGVAANAWMLIDNLWRTALGLILGDSVNSFSEIKWHIEDIMQSVWMIIETAWNFVKETFLNALYAIRALLTGDFAVFKDIVNEQMTLIKDTFKFIWEDIKNIFQSAWALLKALATVAWQALVDKVLSIVQSLVIGAVTVFNNLKNKLQALWAGIVSTAVSIWGKITAPIINIVNDVIRTYRPLITFFKNAWTSIFTAGQTIFNNLSTALTRIWSNIQTIAISAWEIIKNVILGPILLLINLVTGDMEGFKSNLARIWYNIGDAAARIWGAIKDIVVTYIKLIIDNAKVILATYLSIVKGYFTAIWETIKNIWSNIIQSIDSALLTIEAIFNSGMDWIIGILAEAWMFIDELWRNALSLILGDSINNFEEIKHAIEDAMEAVWNIIETVWTFVKETFSNAIGFIMALVRGDFTVMKDFIDQQMKLIKDTIKIIWDNVKTIFSSVLSAIWLTVKEKFQQVKDWATKKLAELLASAISTWNNTKKATAEALASIVTNVKKKFDEVKRAAKDKMEEARKSIENAWNKAKSFLEGIDLEQIGKDVIQGFINGIKSKVRDVASAAQEAADAVTTKIMKILGIASPSKVLTQIGKWTGEGMANGISKSTKNIAAAAKNAASEAIKNLAVKYDTNKINPSSFIAGLKKIQQQYKLTGDQSRTLQKQLHRANQAIQKQAQALKTSLSKINAGVKTAGQTYFNKVKSINDKLAKDIKKAQDDFKKKVADVKNSIYNQTGLFDKVESKKVDGKQLLDNLKGQNSQFKQFNADIAKLQKTGVSKGFINELREMGVGAADEISAIANMPKSMLNDYVKAWKEKHALANNEADKQMAGEKKKMEQHVKSMTAAAKKQLQQANVDWKARLKKLSDEVKKLGDFKNSGKVLGKDTVRGLIKGLQSMKGPLADAARSLARIVESQIKRTLKIKSPSRVMKSLGVFVGEGLDIGLTSMIRSLARTAQQMAYAVTPDLQPVDIAGQVAGINKMATAQMQSTVTSELNVSRQPVVINIYDNKEAVRAYVNEHNAIDAQIRRF